MATAPAPSNHRIGRCRAARVGLRLRRMSELLSFALQHCGGCDATGVEPDRCTCAPTVVGRYGADDWTPIGTLRRGWSRADFARRVILDSRSASKAQPCECQRATETPCSP